MSVPRSAIRALVDDGVRVAFGASLVFGRMSSAECDRLALAITKFIKNNQNTLPSPAAVYNSVMQGVAPQASTDSASAPSLSSVLTTPPEPLKPLLNAASSAVSGITEVAGLMNSLSKAARNQSVPSPPEPFQSPSGQSFSPSLNSNSKFDIPNPIQPAAPKPASAPVLPSPFPSHSPAPPSSVSSVSRSPILSSPPIDIPARKFIPRERSIPTSPIGRIVGFGGIAARLVTGTLIDGIKSVTGTGKSSDGESASAGLAKSAESGLSGPTGTGFSARSSAESAASAAASSSTSSSKGGGSVLSQFMSETNAERLAEGLCRMRGAALKVGQMLSIQDENLLPPQLQQVLDRVRDGADVMPRKQLERALVSELGEDWESKVKSFDWTPIAAASIGQVHKVTLLDGRSAVMKVQYPGVAESINSDVNNVRMLIRMFNMLPKGMFIEETMAAAKHELAIECDYINEAKCQKQFKANFEGHPDVYIPDVIDSLSTKRILTTEMVAGLPIDRIALGSQFALSQEERNRLASTLLTVCLQELFVHRFMQTDPNWSNFLYDPKTQKLNLIDFGASREYRKEFVDEYLRMVRACAERDRDAVIQSSIRMGFLTGDESKEMLNAHVDAAFIVGEPFHERGAYDFVNTDMAGRVSRLAAIMLKFRLTPPPPESYTLHRKLSGCFLTCKKLGAVISCREQFLEVYNNHRFDPVDQTKPITMKKEKVDTTIN